MKRVIGLSLAGLLAFGSIAFAGPAPGQPGPGERSGEIARSRTHDLGSSATAYALTGGDQGRASDCDEPSSLSLTNRRHCDPSTTVSDRRQPGGTN